MDSGSRDLVNFFDLTVIIHSLEAHQVHENSKRIEAQGKIDWSWKRQIPDSALLSSPVL